MFGEKFGSVKWYRTHRIVDGSPSMEHLIFSVMNHEEIFLMEATLGPCAVMGTLEGKPVPLNQPLEALQPTRGLWFSAIV